MRVGSLRREFFFLFLTVFSLILVFSIFLIIRYARTTAEAARLSGKLQDTFVLNRSIHQGIETQLQMLDDFFLHRQPDFWESFTRINYELGELQTEYLKLDIEDSERLIVGRLRAIHSELAIQANLIYMQLIGGEVGEAQDGLARLRELEAQIHNEFNDLNELQIASLRQVVSELVRYRDESYIGLFLAGLSFLVLLLILTVLFQKRVLSPLDSILAVSERLREGDLAARAPVHRADEIGRLAQRFNYMAESLAESYRQLERKVEERTGQLQELQQQLIQSEKMSALGKLVGGVAHELNNPLTAVLGYTELRRQKLLARAGSESEQRLEEVQDLEVILSQAQRCARIVSNLLQFARQKKPRMETVDINQAVEEVLRLREYHMETRNIALVRELDPARPVIAADSQKIQQVLLNLINNAHDAIEERAGGGTIWVRTFQEGDRVAIQVADDGTGLKEPEKVFDPFYTTKEVGKGTGLGLSVCYGIAQEHGGEIRAENWERGAQFTLWVPVGTPEPVRSETRSPNPSSRSLRSGKVLIVDDEKALVQLQEKLLTDLGLESIGVDSGDDAIRFLATHSVDLIISDIRMPGEVDGSALLEWVRTNRPRLLPRFILLPGDSLQIQAAAKPGPREVPCLKKPFEPAEYVRTVLEVLER